MFDSIFKAYDIRGKYPEEINEEVFNAVGAAFSKFVKSPAIMVGYDMRVSSPTLAAAFCQGVVSSGKEAILLNLIPTDASYFAAGKYNLPVAMITASHNPPQYNGLKLTNAGAIPIGEKSGLEEIKKLSQNKFLSNLLGNSTLRARHCRERTERPTGREVSGDRRARRGAVAEEIVKKNILPEYVEHVLSFIPHLPRIPRSSATGMSGLEEILPARSNTPQEGAGFINTSALTSLKIAIDAGNGMAGLIVPKIFQQLPITIIPLYFELNGTMPNHEPNPIDPKNVEELIKTVKKEKCSLGLAFDGDADRVFFIDENGARISASLITALIAKIMLAKNPGSTIIYNAVCSRIVPETIKTYGGAAVRERVGHSFIKATMAKTDAVFAGEHSGHYYFRDNFRADSGIIAALIVIEMLVRAKIPFSHLLKEFQKYFSIEETNSEVADKNKVLNSLKQKFADAKIEEFDGLTFTYPDYWFNVRPSNTEPKLRLNLEARAPQLRDQKSQEVLKEIQNFAF